MLKQGKVNLLIDGQFGSTGKGLLASYIGNSNGIDLCVSNSGPNSGHTFYFSGKKNVVKQLPVTAITNPKSIIYLCSGSVINIDILLEELDFFKINTKRLNIHPNATIITEDDIKCEHEGPFVKISSTQNGVGAALCGKVGRYTKVAKDYRILSEYIKELDIPKLLNELKYTIFMEVPQGYSLSLNSKFYPYCTSRNINVSAALNDLGVHPYYLGNVIVSLRTFPIRVGNLPYGYSGDFYNDSSETTWGTINVEKEYTTNTKRIRRVATFSLNQYNDMLVDLRPDYVFLNFCNYLEEGELNELLCLLPEVTHVGFGPKIEDVRLLYNE